jgi:hypothetical protein
MRNALLGLLVIGVFALVGFEIKKEREAERQKAADAAYLKKLKEDDHKSNEFLKKLNELEVK